MNFSLYTKKINHGFTLIEVVVALAILTWVLGGSIFLVNQYASERSKMRERFLMNQVGWNQLMEEYRSTHNWRIASELGPEEKGIASQGTQDWRWQMDIEPALGRDLYRYQVSVASLENDGELTPTLSLYLTNSRDEQ